MITNFSQLEEQAKIGRVPELLIISEKASTHTYLRILNDSSTFGFQ
jgi:hypothetical protein